MSGNMHNKVDCCVGVQQENPIYNSICLQDPVSQVDGESRQTRKVKPLRGRSESGKAQKSVNDVGKVTNYCPKMRCEKLPEIKHRPADTSLLILYNSMYFN